jgi:integrase
LNHSGNRNVFEPNFHRSVKASTVGIRRKQILQIVSALVASGVDANQITGLATLVDPANAKAALAHLYQRKASQTTPYLGQQALLLVTIARYWVSANAADIAALRDFSTALTPKRAGMVPRNRERLRQFDLPANITTLVHLPIRVLQQVQRSDSRTYTDALRVMLAIAVKLLLITAIRADNLCGLDLDCHFITVRRGRADVRYIKIPSTESKNGEVIERSVPQDTCARLDIYLKIYRPLLTTSPSTLLFPGMTGRRRTTSCLSHSVGEFVYRETGIRLHSHLFRHVAAKIYLDRYPNGIETVRQILGHKSTATTLRSYAENRTDQAFKKWDLTLDSLRNGPKITHTPKNTLQNRQRRPGDTK